MSDDPNPKKEALTQTGMMPRSILEPDTKSDPPPKPTTMPEFLEKDSANTGTFRAVIEGEDDTTDQDEAYSTGQ